MITSNYSTVKSTPYEKTYLNYKRAGRKQDPESWYNAQMGGTEELIKAFICDNADRGHAYNLIIYGDTLYLDEGNDGKNLFFYQLAIRLPSGVYILNMRDKHHEHMRYIRKVLTHSQSWMKYISLPTLNHKKDHGEIEPPKLRTAIKEEHGIAVVKRALKRYGREQMQAAACENIHWMHITLERLNHPDRKKYYDTLIISEAIRETQRTKKVCKMLDKYLDILTQFPELKP